MINFFKMADNDLSMTYLNQIFGTMNGLLPSATLPIKALNDYTTSSSMTMIGMMFNTFNSIMLAIGALIVVYMTVVGVMYTAHEGEFMGKKWNNIWLPIRTVLGVATLVPTASGYSTIQLVMMWIIVQGIAAADTLWSTTLSARAVLGTPYSDAKTPDISAQQHISNIFKGLVCAATTNLSYTNPSGGETGKYYCKGKNCGDAFYQFVSGGSTEDNKIQLGYNGVCGTVSYCNPDPNRECKKPGSMKCMACTKQNEALADIVPTLAGIAEQLAKVDYTYREFMATSYYRTDVPEWQPIYDYCAQHNPPIAKANCCKASPTADPLSGLLCAAGSGEDLPPVDYLMGGGQYDDSSPSESAVSDLYYPYFMGDADISNFQAKAANDYSTALQEALRDYIAQSSADPSNLQSASVGIPGFGLPAGPIFENAARMGWIMAGTFYYVVAIEGAPSALPDSVPDINVDLSNAANLTKFRTNIEAAGALMDAAASAAHGDGSAEPGYTKLTMQKSGSGGGKSFVEKKILKPLTNIIMNAFETITATINLIITAVGGPINALQMLGQLLMMLAATLYTAFFLISIAVGILAGTGSVVALGNGIPELISAPVFLAYILIAPFFLLFIGWLLVTGAMLAVFLPLVPYTIFLFGVIGWFTAVIEAMVAAPLVAIGILSPSGQHELMGKSEAAIGMMLALFLRPSLMVFGMIGAMLLVVVVLSFILSSFGLAVLFITKGLIDPISIILFVSALVFLVISAVTKCFSLIHLIPHNVMMWIGVHHTPGDRGEAPVDEMKGKVSGAASSGVQAGEKGSQAATGRAEKIGDRKNTAKAEAAKGGDSTITPK